MLPSDRMAKSAVSRIFFISDISNCKYIICNSVSAKLLQRYTLFYDLQKNTAHNLAVSGKDATFAHWIRPQYLGVDWI
jgi:hypothetical protein